MSCVFIELCLCLCLCLSVSLSLAISRRHVIQRLTMSVAPNIVTINCVRRRKPLPRVQSVRHRKRICRPSWTVCLQGGPKKYVTTNLSINRIKSSIRLDFCIEFECSTEILNVGVKYSMPDIINYCAWSCRMDKISKCTKKSSEILVKDGIVVS